MFNFFKKKQNHTTNGKSGLISGTVNIKNDENKTREFMNDFRYRMSKEGSKQIAYQCIENEVDRAIFNVLSMNENKMNEIYNCVDWSKVIVTGDSGAFKSSIIFLKLMTTVVDHSDVVMIEKTLNQYLNKEISDIQANRYLQDLLIGVGASHSFYSNAILYVDAHISK